MPRPLRGNPYAKVWVTEATAIGLGLRPRRKHTGTGLVEVYYRTVEPAITQDRAQRGW